MELHGKHPAVFILEALYGAIVDIHMADTRHIWVYALRLHHIAVVLGGDIDPSGIHIPHRMIAAPVPIFEFFRSSSCSQCHELMAQAHREDHHIRSIELFQFLNDLHIIRRISGAVG